MTVLVATLIKLINPFHSAQRESILFCFYIGCVQKPQAWKHTVTKRLTGPALLLFAILFGPSISHASSNSSSTWSRLYRQHRAAVVRVRCGVEYGAGTLVQDHRTILTSSSIVGCGRTIWVQASPNSPEFPARMLKASAKSDLALLHLPRPLKARPLQLKPWPVKIGASVGLIGHPFLDRGPLQRRAKTLQPWSFLKGVVSQTRKNVLQINAPLMGGCIGAPVFDEEGHLVGMLSEASPWGQPMGKAIPISVIRHFLKPSTQPPPWPYFTYDILLQARISYPLKDTTTSSLPASTQELRLDLIFADQWIVGFIVGIDLISLSSDYTFSLVSSVHLEYRWLMPNLARPYLDYIAFGVGVIASQIELKKELNTKNLDFQAIADLLKIQQRFSIWIGLRFYAFLGKFSVGVFLDPADFSNPIFTVAWGFATKQ
jgi:hypothetical protein